MKDFAILMQLWTSQKRIKKYKKITILFLDKIMIILQSGVLWHNKITPSHDTIVIQS